MAEIIKEHPNYYAIIPANVRYDKELKPNEKLLYAEITSLTQKSGICYASNNYFAELYGVTKETVSGWISNLEKNGYIKREIIYKEGTKEIINRYIRINEYPINEKINTPINEIINTPINEKIKDNNTSINNTSINKEKKKDYATVWKEFVNSKSEDFKIAWKAFMDFRKSKKGKDTDYALYLLTRDLQKFTLIEEEQIEIINNSLKNKWTGLFALKNKPVQNIQIKRTESYGGER